MKHMKQKHALIDWLVGWLVKHVGKTCWINTLVKHVGKCQLKQAKKRDLGSRIKHMKRKLALID